MDGRLAAPCLCGHETRYRGAGGYVETVETVGNVDGRRVMSVSGLAFQEFGRAPRIMSPMAARLTIHLLLFFSRVATWYLPRARPAIGRLSLFHPSPCLPRRQSSPSPAGSSSHGPAFHTFHTSLPRRSQTYNACTRPSTRIQYSC